MSPPVGMAAAAGKLYHAFTSNIQSLQINYCELRSSNVLAFQLSSWPDDPQRYDFKIPTPTLIGVGTSIYAFVSVQPIMESTAPPVQGIIEIWCLDALDPSATFQFVTKTSQFGGGEVRGMISDDTIYLVQKQPGPQSVNSMSILTFGSKDIAASQNWKQYSIDGIRQVDPMACWPATIYAVNVAGNTTIRLIYNQNSDFTDDSWTRSFQELIFTPSDPQVWSKTTSTLSSIQFHDCTVVTSPDATWAWLALYDDNASYISTWVPGATSWSKPQSRGGGSNCAYGMGFLNGTLFAEWSPNGGYTFFNPGLMSTFASGWMFTMQDDVLMTQLSIPGTYASATGNDRSLMMRRGTLNGKSTQNMSIKQQLDAGIRFLHFIIGKSSDSGIGSAVNILDPSKPASSDPPITGPGAHFPLALFAPDGTQLDVEMWSLMKEICDWLEQGSMEALVIFLSAVNGQQNLPSLATALNEMLIYFQKDYIPDPEANPLANSEAKPQPKPHFVLPKDCHGSVTLGTCRGKILLMHNLNNGADESTGTAHLDTGIDLGTTYPDPTIVSSTSTSLTAKNGTLFQIQDSFANDTSSEDQSSGPSQKLSIVTSALESVASNGSIGWSKVFWRGWTGGPQLWAAYETPNPPPPTPPTPSTPPTNLNTWFLTWSNINFSGSGAAGWSSDRRSVATTINRGITQWVGQRAASTDGSQWWPRMGVVIADFADLGDGTFPYRVFSTNGWQYSEALGFTALPASTSD
ncbi:hypothetical protein IL306_000308 [Fusarium sp. DS 682]|nr:hypothetical protein IL306_000308 [Fusarium sp. DS 682]